MTRHAIRGARVRATLLDDLSHLSLRSRNEDWTFLDCAKLVRPPSSVTDAAVGFNKPRAGTISIDLGRREDFDLSIEIQATDSFKGIAHDATFRFELRRILDMLPRTSTAVAKVATARLASLCAWLDESRNLRPGHSLAEL